WMGPRPDEPQLPMYALGAGDADEVAAVAFAQVRTGAMRFRGNSREANLVPDVVVIERDRRGKSLYRNWAHLLAEWRRELDAIGAAFASGDARVDPKAIGKSCSLCEQHSFCRIDEKAPFGASEADADE